MDSQNYAPLKNQEQAAVENFAKCLTHLRKILDENTLINEYPEAKEALFQKYTSLAKFICQNYLTHLSEEIVKAFCKVINHENDEDGI